MTRRRLRMRARRANAGFTLLEMLVALVAGAMAIATVYTLGAGSTRAFQEQNRIAHMQAAVRSAMEQVRRDIAQHGLANPDITLAHLTRQLGYAEQSVLTRACQRWFGTTPTLYRATLLAASG